MEVLTVKTVTAYGQTLKHIPVSSIKSIVIIEDNKGGIRATIEALGAVVHINDKDDALALAKKLKPNLVNEFEAKEKHRQISEQQAIVAEAHKQARLREEKKQMELEAARLAAESEIAKRKEAIAKAKEAAVAKAREAREKLEADKAKQEEASEKAKATIKKVEKKISKKKASKK